MKTQDKTNMRPPFDNFSINDRAHIAENLKITIELANRTVVTNHWHGQLSQKTPYARLYYIIKGWSDLTIETKSVRVSQNQLVLIPSQTFLVLNTPRRELEHIWIHFTASIGRGTSLFDILKFPVTLSPSEPAPIIYDLERLLEFHSSRSLGHFVRAQALMRNVLALFIDNGQAKHKTNSLKERQEFQPALDYIDNHLSETITNEKLAKTTHLSLNYFSDKFRKNIGVSPSQYISVKRVEKAQALLLNTDHSIKEIAGMIGYDDEFYFSRVFRKHAGMAPGRYRKMARLSDRESRDNM